MILKQKNQIQALKAKMNLQDIKVEDAERACSRMQQENIQLKEKNESMKKMSDVIRMIEEHENRNSEKIQMGVFNGVQKSVNWAAQIRKNQSLDQQAQIFYESYRIILVKEDGYKERINNLRAENEKLQKYKMASEADYQYLKKKYQNTVDKNKLLKTEIEAL